jgi:hypothetical protein
MRAGKPRTAAESKIASLAAFNRIVKIFATTLGKQFPQDAFVARAQKRINLAVEADPVYILDNVGAYLVKYNKEIDGGDEKFFLENDYDAELRAGVKEEKVAEVKIIMPKIKDAWKTLDDKTKESYKRHVKEMLGHYLDYRLGKPAPTTSPKN